MKNNKWLFAFAILFVVFIIAGCGTGTAAAEVSPVTNLSAPLGQAATTPTANIIVNGTGHVLVNPDVAIVQFGAQATQPTLNDATTDVSNRISAILSIVKGMGVSDNDIKTVSYSISPQYNQIKNNNETPRIVGYSVSNIVQVKIRKLDNVGKIVDAAVNAGANTLGGLTFTIDDSSKAEADARKQAVQNAMDKAKQLTDAAGVKLGEMIYISENVNSPQPLSNRFFGAAPAAADSVGPGPVQSGQLEVSVNVEIHYTIGK